MNRQEYFRQLACSVHTWPICGCEQCLENLMSELDRRREQESQARRALFEKVHERRIYGDVP